MSKIKIALIVAGAAVALFLAAAFVDGVFIRH